MHTKTDSEATSLSPSSPAHSPRRPVYYVQSPSRDSHDGEKTATSFHSTPTASPPHSHSSVGHHSRDSSSTRFSGSLKPGSGKITPPLKPGHKQIAVIDEEGYYDHEADDSNKGVPRRCYLIIFVLGFLVLFGLFSLILWGVSKSQKPEITVKSIQMETFVIQAGSDNTGVATDMVTMNSTVKLIFRNTASFFGVHVVSTPVDLSYSQITLASGAIKKFYQSRKSKRTLTISVNGNRIPLYGSGANLSSNTTGSPTLPVALKLSMVVKSKAYVLGKLVKPKFKKKIECSVEYDPKEHNGPISLKNSCTYK